MDAKIGDFETLCVAKEKPVCIHLPFLAICTQINSNLGFLAAHVGQPVKLAV